MLVENRNAKSKYGGQLIVKFVRTCIVAVYEGATRFIPAKVIVTAVTIFRTSQPWAGMFERSLPDGAKVNVRLS